MNLNLFEDRNPNGNFVEKFLEELKSSLEKMTKRNTNMSTEKVKEENTTGKYIEKEDSKSQNTENEKMHDENNDLEEYNLFEKRKIFLDNKSRKGNELAWITDENSVYISEDGDGGIYFISETDLPDDVKAGEVYQKIDGKYVIDSSLTEEINSLKSRN